MDFKDKKVLLIGDVSELTGLTVRQIRYYEERKLIFPDRSQGKTRKYSFNDVETLEDIATKLEEGTSTYEIKKDMKKKETSVSKRELRNNLIKGQINAAFHMRKK